MDEAGEAVGFFLPLLSYRALLKNLQIPLSAEELQRRSAEEGAIPLEEFWKQMGQS
jgi:hypothetical protein